MKPTERKYSLSSCSENQRATKQLLVSDIHEHYIQQLELLAKHRKTLVNVRYTTSSGQTEKLFWSQVIVIYYVK